MFPGVNFVDGCLADNEEPLVGLVELAHLQHLPHPKEDIRKRKEDKKKNSGGIIRFSVESLKRF